MAAKPEPNGDPEEAARLRAAFAYAGKTKAERARILGVALRTVSRWESAETKIPSEAWPLVADATGVPAWFIESGFAIPPQPEEPTLAERVDALEMQISALVKQRAGDETEPPPAELLQPHAAPQPKTDTGTGDARRRARGAQ